MQQQILNCTKINVYAVLYTMPGARHAAFIYAANVVPFWKVGNVKPIEYLISN